MRIRSVTAFAELSYPLEAGTLNAAGDALRNARQALTAAGFEVQTVRLATQPFPAVLANAGPGKVADLAQDIEALAFVHEIDYVGLGPARLDDPATYVEAMPEVFEHTERVFASVIIADKQVGLSLPRIRRTAELIRRVATLTEDGFCNLRLAALANVPHWSPFFPAAYHSQGGPRIAVATESADLAVTAIESANSLEGARKAIVRAVEVEAERIETALHRAELSGFAFHGIDFSLAPYPEASRSIGAALEHLGLPAFGEQGTLAAAAFLTDALDQAQFRRTGFCGLMLPVLEDPVLADRAAGGRLRASDLLTWSAVCGTGLDTIPLPGDVSQDALAAILLDVAALALRLDKPLTARLMPLPGKQAGDEAAFEFEFFAPSRVMAADSGALSGLLAGDERLPIQPLGRRS